MNATTATGIAASVFTAISLIPQLLKLIKEKKGEHVSIGMLATLLIGLIFWMIYGCLKGDLIIIISNSFSLLVNIITCCLTFKYKKET